MGKSPRPSARRVVVTVTIGSFSIAALMGVAALLRPGHFGRLEGQVLLTTLVVGAASILMLCYLAVSESSYRLVGAVGGAAVLVAAPAALILIWGYLNDSAPTALVRTFGVATVVAATLAQFCLLLALGTRRRPIAWLLWSTLALGSLLAVLVSSSILGYDGGDRWGRFLGVVMIFDVLGTVVTVALAVFGGESGRVAGRLNVSVDEPLAGRVRRLAEESGRPVSEVTTEALERYVDSRVDA